MNDIEEEKSDEDSPSFGEKRLSEKPIKVPLMKSVKSDIEKVEPIRQQTTELAKARSTETPKSASERATPK